MKLKFNMPVNLIFGTGVIKENTEKFRIGKKALIVTGKNSAILSGALDDVVSALCKEGLDYVVFDQIINNPSIENVAAGAEFGKKYNVDFIIAIGGGSPIDAAKAIAALCTNDIDSIELVKGVPDNKSLPIIAVPTTSGTGSEVTPYSILTVPSMNTKRNFYSPYSFPVYAFADPAYTYSLPYNITIDTAFDAFSHLLESYLSVRSTPLNDALVLEGIKAWAACKNNIINSNFDKKTREALMYASCVGGIAITHTGTTIIHAMGYSLTYFKNYTHGRANAMIIGEYLKFNSAAAGNKINRVLDILGFEDADEADGFFSLGGEKNPVITDEECRMYTELAMGQGSVKLNPRKVDSKDIYELYRKIFGGVQ